MIANRFELRLITPLFLLICLVLLLPLQAQAHRVNVFAWVEEGTVHTQSKFAGGTKVNKGTIEVYDDNARLLLNGTTNENGEFSFTIPQKTALKVVLIATMGHRAEWDIPLSEIDADALESTAKPTKKETPTLQPEQRDSSRMDQRQLEEIVDRIMERKLKPVNSALANLQQPGPSVHDIIAGIGYICGLMGIAAWVRYRRK